MKIGAMDNVLAKPWSELFDEAARLGFDGVELDLKVDTYLSSEVWSEGGRKALIERSKRAGVAVASVCMASVAGLMVDPDTHAQGVQAVADLRRHADELGAGVILFPMIPGQDEQQTFELWRDGFRAVFAQTPHCRTKVGMESVGRKGRSAVEHLTLIEAVGSPDLGVYYDLGNAAYQGYDNVRELTALCDRVFQIHVKEIGAEMGCGTLHFSELFRVIRHIGYDGYLVLETNAGDDPAGNAARNLAFVKAML